jgi:hypothetical protein
MRFYSLFKVGIPCAALVGLAVSTYLLFLKRSPKTAILKVEISPLGKSELLQILQALLSQFHGVFVELANMVQRLKQLGALRGPGGPMSSEQIADFLMQQGIQSKLDAAQSRVLLSHKVSQEQVEEAQDRLSQDIEVQKFVEGFSQMYEEASNGLIPILPGLEIPQQLNEDAALDILNKIHMERVKAFRSALERFWSSPEAAKMEVMDPSQGPPPALAKQLQTAHDEAEAFVIDLHADIIGNKAVFDSAVALFSRKADGAFLKEKLRMERSHQVEIVNLMRNRSTAEAPKLESIPGISEKLICSNEADMAHHILQGAEEKRPVVAALVRNLDDPKGALSPLSDAIETGKLTILTERNCTFLYMAAHDDIPLASRPEYKTVEVCYIFFPRPDKQQRPVACFSLEELQEASSVDTSIYEGPGSVVFANEVDRVD